MALKKKKVTKKGAKQNIVLETNKGNITIELLDDLAPNHCKRILQLSKDGFFAFGIGRDRKYDVVITSIKNGKKNRKAY